MAKYIPDNIITEEYQAMIFDRSNPLEIVCICPPNNPNYPEYPNGFEHTRIEDIRFQNRGVGRTDLGMVNHTRNGKFIAQMCIYGNKDGSIDWRGCRDYFSSEQRKELKAIVARIIEASKEYPEMIGYLR